MRQLTVFIVLLCSVFYASANALSYDISGRIRVNGLSYDYEATVITDNPLDKSSNYHLYSGKATAHDAVWDGDYVVADTIIVSSEYNDVIKLPVKEMFMSIMERTCENITSSIFIPKTVEYILFPQVLFQYNRHLKSVSIDQDNPCYTLFDGNLYNKDLSRFISSTYARTSDEVILPDGVTSIEEDAFDDYITKVHIPEGVTEIGDFAFGGCRLIEEIKLPKSIQTIGHNVFALCESLKEIDLSNVVSYGHSLFLKCKSLKSIIWPKEESCISHNNAEMFKGCTSLEPIHIPAYMTLGSSMFEDCYYLKSILYEGDIDVIPNDFCKNCMCLSEFIVPRTVTEIGECAFWGCNNLKHVVIGENVAKLERESFWGSGIESIELLCENPPAADDAFYNGTFKKARLTVPESSVQLYQEDKIWKQFYMINNISTLDDLTNEAEMKYCDVFTPAGAQVREGVAREEWSEGLPAGIYILRSGSRTEKVALTR